MNIRHIFHRVASRISSISLSSSISVVRTFSMHGQPLMPPLPLGPTAHPISLTQIRAYKPREVLHLRCKDCRFERREGRLYVECSTFPRHKQYQKVLPKIFPWSYKRKIERKIAENLRITTSGPLGCAWQNGMGVAVGTVSPAVLKYICSKGAAFPTTGYVTKNQTLPDTIFFVNWGSQMYIDEFMAKLAIASSDIFQKFVSKSEKTDLIIYQTSTSYRAELRATLQQINDFLSKVPEDFSADQDRVAHVASEAELLMALDTIWHLTEIVFLSSCSPKRASLSLELQSWFHMQWPQAAQFYSTAVHRHQDQQRGDASEPEDAEMVRGYWAAVSLLVLQARVQEAATLLELCPATLDANLTPSEKQLRSRLSQCLLRMPAASWMDDSPAPSGIGGRQVVHSDALHMRTYWRGSVRELVDEFAHLKHPHGTNDNSPLLLLATVIAARGPRVQSRGSASADSSFDSTSGCNMDVLMALSQLSEEWLQPWLSPSRVLTWHWLLVPYIFYAEPALQRTQLALVTRSFRTAFQRLCPPQHADNWLDSSMGYILDTYIHGLIHNLAVECNCWWLLSHLLHLLHHIPLLTTQPPRTNGEQMCESSALLEDFFLKYVESLWSSAVQPCRGVSLTPFCATLPYTMLLTYLDHCPQYGAALAEELLLRVYVDLDNRLQVDKILHHMRRRGLHSAAEILCFRVAREHLGRGHWLDAVYWACVCYSCVALEQSSCLQRQAVQLIRNALQQWLLQGLPVEKDVEDEEQALESFMEHCGQVCRALPPISMLCAPFAPEAVPPVLRFLLSHLVILDPMSAAGGGDSMLLEDSIVVTRPTRHHVQWMDSTLHLVRDLLAVDKRNFHRGVLLWKAVLREGVRILETSFAVNVGVKREAVLEKSELREWCRVLHEAKPFMGKEQHLAKMVVAMKKMLFQKLREVEFS